LSARVSTDSSGTVVGQQGHFPFGESSYSVNSTTKWQFTSYERDSESGNDYAIMRSSVNRLARFSSPDPIAGTTEDPQSLNHYAYGRNDPVNLADPLGLFTITFLLVDCKWGLLSPGNESTGATPVWGWSCSSSSSSFNFDLGNEGGGGGGGDSTKPRVTKKQCIHDALVKKFGSFVADKVVPQFSLLSAADNWRAFATGSAISAGAKLTVWGSIRAYGQILTVTGRNMLQYPGLAAAGADALEAGAFWTTTAATAGAVVGISASAVVAFATAADHWAREQCKNVP
jgi:RHS repeat-associated protein